MATCLKLSVLLGSAFLCSAKEPVTTLPLEALPQEAVKTLAAPGENGGACLSGGTCSNDNLKCVTGNDHKVWESVRSSLKWTLARKPNVCIPIIGANGECGPKAKDFHPSPCVEGSTCKAKSEPDEECKKGEKHTKPGDCTCVTPTSKEPEKEEEEEKPVAKTEVGKEEKPVAVEKDEEKETPAKDLNADCFNKHGAPHGCVEHAECLTPDLGTCPDKADKECTCQKVIAEHKYCGGGNNTDPQQCASGLKCQHLGDKDTDLRICARGDDEDKCACVAPVKEEDGKCGPLTAETHHLKCEGSMACMHVKANDNDDEKPCDMEKAEKLEDCTCKSTGYAWWVWVLISLAVLLVIALAICVICSCAGKKNNP